LKKKEIIISLVCTGAKTEFYDNIIKAVKEMGLQNLFFHLGLVTKEELAGLYKLASATVLPTLYEAGSAPLYEAMFFNCPVICSNVTSLPDTIGNDEFIFDPNDIQQISEKIKKIVFDNEYRSLNVANSKQQINHFFNLDSTGDFIKAYKNVTK